MKIVPVIKPADLERSMRFYTEILDFERKWPGRARPEHFIAPGVSRSSRAGRSDPGLREFVVTEHLTVP